MKIKDVSHQRHRDVYVVELEGSDEGKLDHELIATCSVSATRYFPGGVVVRGRDGRAVVYVWKD